MASPHVAGMAARHYQQDMMYNQWAIRGLLQTHAAGRGDVPFDSPTTSYSSDGNKEGVAQAPPPPTT